MMIFFLEHPKDNCINRRGKYNQGTPTEKKKRVGRYNNHHASSLTPNQKQKKKKTLKKLQITDNSNTATGGRWGLMIWHWCACLSNIFNPMTSASSTCPKSAVKSLRYSLSGRKNKESVRSVLIWTLLNISGLGFMHGDIPPESTEGGKCPTKNLLSVVLLLPLIMLKTIVL